MELTIESALSTDGLLGHLSYFLLVLSMMMRRMTWLRILAISSAITGISYSVLVLNDPVGAFWETALLIVNIAQLLFLHWKNLTARFSQAELDFVTEKFPGLGRGLTRDLLDLGKWIAASEGDIITEEGRNAGRLTYIASGTIDIIVGGVRVSECGKGSFIGEMTVLGEDPATATTRVKVAAELWQIDGKALKQIVQRHPEVARELEASFARNYRDKIVRANQLVAKGLVP